MASKKPLQPTVEDYFSDDGHGQGVSIEPFTPDPSPGKANVRTKRSNPDHMGADRTPTGRVPANIDVKSDSGYSSQSVAGMSSADSAASAASSQRGPPVLPAAPSPTPTQKPSRPPHSRQQSQQSSQSASRHPLSRRDSQSSRRPHNTERRPNPPGPKRRDSRNDECTTPGCHCSPELPEPRPRPQARRLSMLNTQPHPAESAPDVSSHHIYDTRSQVSDPAQYPSSPRESLPLRYHAPQGGPVIQPAVSRRLSINGRQPRPTSYHGEPNWPRSGMHPSHPSPQEHGPPPSRSAYMPYAQSPMNPQYMPAYPPQGHASNAYYHLAQSMQPMQPMHDQQRPPLQARAQTTAYGYPAPAQAIQVERSDRHMPSTRYHSNALPPAPAQRQQPRIAYPNEEDDGTESESESESESEAEAQYPLRRPQQGASQRRPSLRHAKTTPAPPVPEIRRPQTIVVPQPRESRNHDRGQAPRTTRRDSMSRPPLVPTIKSRSEYDSPRARVIVEGPRSSRRDSQVYDRPVHREPRRTHHQEYNDSTRSKRSSRVYENVATSHDYERDYHDDDEEVEPVAQPLRRRRGTDVEGRRRSHRPVEVRQQADAEDYINLNRGERKTLADQSYEVARKRSSRTSGGPSEAESSRSRGSDNNGEIRLQLPNDAPVILNLTGDMEGRALRFVPAENGINELVISSNARGSESAYPGGRGSVRGERRAIMPPSQPRRDLEEMTERSSQSNRTKRERTDRPSRRERRDSDYQY